MVPLSGEEKGALLLNSLAPEVAEKILTRLGSARGGRLRALMERVQQGPQTRKILSDLMNEIRQAMSRKGTEKPERPEDILAAPASSAGLPSTSHPAAPESAAARQAEPESPAAPTNLGMSRTPRLRLAPLPSIPEGQDPLQSLGAIPPERIALVLESETARTTSIILNFLDGDAAGEVFRRLPKELRAEVSVQFSSQAMPNLEMLRRMALALVQKCHKLQDKPEFPEGLERLRKMADMLRPLEKTQRQQVLGELEARAPDAADQIKAMMYRFDDVLRLDNRSMQKILKEVDSRNLAISLRDAADAIKEKFLSNLSRRAQENLAEEIELIGSAPRNEVEQAQAAIAQIIQRMDLAGELVMTD